MTDSTSEKNREERQFCDWGKDQRQHLKRLYLEEHKERKVQLQLLYHKTSEVPVCTAVQLHYCTVTLPLHYKPSRKQSPSCKHPPSGVQLPSQQQPIPPGFLSQDKVVPDALVGALTSCFRLRIRGDVLRGQDLGEACWSANSLSQVRRRWVVGAHAVLGADSVAALHTLHLSETEAQQQPQKAEPWHHTALKEVMGGGWKIKS